eukprot:gnl/TRDRNA2_/TRDRNA2_172015_c1_seq10.p1 gnl/TRDRNA2_/TRDRNA2_172015_c1~~gnl/TRDRNA2_/TRDRNA2_172015_c1_seq10.p1  ORF type:complete len:189 (+),score=23.50 gnl/TRDRNA2_/TRDRNA2_172015_c1_seq10:51-617(+)
MLSCNLTFGARTGRWCARMNPSGAAAPSGYSLAGPALRELPLLGGLVLFLDQVLTATPAADKQSGLRGAFLQCCAGSWHAGCSSSVALPSFGNLSATMMAWNHIVIAAAGDSLGVGGPGGSSLPCTLLLVPGVLFAICTTSAVLELGVRAPMGVVLKATTCRVGALQHCCSACYVLVVAVWVPAMHDV